MATSSEWDATELKDEANTSLKVGDIKQLLITRGANKKKLKGKKSDLINLLKNNYTATLPKPKDLTMKQVQTELKLWGINNQSIDKIDLIARLINKDNQWLELKAPKVKVYRNTAVNDTLVRINDNEFYAFFTLEEKMNRIFKYNAKQNYWDSSEIELDDTFDIKYDSDANVSVAFNPIDKLMYVYCVNDYYGWQKSILFKINYETEEIIRIPVDEDLSLSYVAGSLFINNKLHLIGSQHLILDIDEDSNQVDECICSSFNKCKAKYIYSNFTGKLISNGSKNVFYGSGEMIYSYNSTLNEWSQLNIKIPCVCKNDAFVFTADHRYILLFQNIGDIYVIDLKWNKVSKSRIVCPFRKVNYSVVITRNNLRSELMVFGFVRKCWNEYEIGLHIFPPRYIVKLMELWVVEEYVHLLYDDRCSLYYNYCHRKMNVEHIINNLE
eukprot:364915_1